MQRPESVQLSVRVAPKTLNLLREHTESKGGMGVIVDKAVAAYFNDNQDQESALLKAIAGLHAQMQHIQNLQVMGKF